LALVALKLQALLHRQLAVLHLSYLQSHQQAAVEVDTGTHLHRLHQQAVQAAQEQALQAQLLVQQEKVIKVMQVAMELLVHSMAEAAAAALVQ
jgi:hypothetical protein